MCAEQRGTWGMAIHHFVHGESIHNWTSKNQSESTRVGAYHYIRPMLIHLGFSFFFFYGFMFLIVNQKEVLEGWWGNHLIHSSQTKHHHFRPWQKVFVIIVLSLSIPRWKGYLEQSTDAKYFLYIYVYV